VADDLISFSFDTSAFDAMTVEIKDPTRRATMYAMRATGRALARIAKSNAPVYSGTDSRVNPGDLKKSIRNARTMVAAADNYELKFGPFGSKKKGTSVTRHGTGKGQIRGVPLYRGAMETKYGYMASAMGMADATVEALFTDAYAKAWAKWSV
jgi:hypothetical protein